MFKKHSHSIMGLLSASMLRISQNLSSLDPSLLVDLEVFSAQNADNVFACHCLLLKAATVRWMCSETVHDCVYVLSERLKSIMLNLDLELLCRA